MRTFLTFLAFAFAVFVFVPNANATGVFLETCTLAQHKQEDPLIAFGPGQSAHDHEAFCNTAWDGSATVAQMQAGGTTALVKSDKASVWTPTIVSPLGQTVLAAKMQYDLRNDKAGDVVVPPDMFAYIKDGPAIWQCIGAPTNTQKFTIPTNCDAYGNKGVVAANYFTFGGGSANICWDGVNPGPGFGRTTGPVGARSHVIGHLAADGSCPAPNQRVVGNGWHVTFPPAAIGGRLSSDDAFDNPGDSWHVDHVQVNRAFVVKIAADCLNYQDGPLTTTCVIRADGGVYRKSDGKLVTF